MLYSFLNIVTSNLIILIGGHLLLGGKPKGYEVERHIVTKVEVDPQMLSTLKKIKIHLKHEPRRNF